MIIMMMIMIMMIYYDNNNYKAPMTLNFRTILLINTETSKICLTYKLVTC